MSKIIAIIFGGNSAEFGISKKSAQVVYKNLVGGKYTPYLVEITQEGWFAVMNGVKFPITKDDFSFVKDGNKIQFDAVFNAIHDTPGEDGTIQGYFELMGIPYNSSGIIESALTFNKWACNNFLKQFGIISAKSILLSKKDKADLDQIGSEIGFPCFVKPNCGGSSFGISKVEKAEELSPAIEKAFGHDNSIVIEEFVDGTEVTSGVVSMHKELIALPLTEIVPDGDFFDYEAKYEGKSKEITPARISEKLATEIQAITKRIYTLLKLKGMIRADYLIKNDVPHLVEVNTVPGLSEESIIPQQVKQLGIKLSDFFENSIKECIEADLK